MLSSTGQSGSSALGFINLHAHVGVELMASVVDVARSGRFAPSEEFALNAPLFMWPTLTPEQQRLGAEFSLVQMLRTGTTTVVDAHGYGPIWWLGNPPTDEAYLGRGRGPHWQPRLPGPGFSLGAVLPKSRRQPGLALG